MNPESCNQISENINAASPDQEVWVRNAVYTAIKMALSLNSHNLVRASAILADCAIRGIVVGTTIEILDILGKRPRNGYVNLGDFEC